MNKSSGWGDLDEYSSDELMKEMKEIGIGSVSELTEHDSWVNEAERQIKRYKRKKLGVYETVEDQTLNTDLEFSILIFEKLSLIKETEYENKSTDVENYFSSDCGCTSTCSIDCGCTCTCTCTCNGYCGCTCTYTCGCTGTYAYGHSSRDDDLQFDISLIKNETKNDL